VRALKCARKSSFCSGCQSGVEVCWRRLSAVGVVSWRSDLMISLLVAALGLTRTAVLSVVRATAYAALISYLCIYYACEAFSHD